MMLKLSNGNFISSELLAGTAGDGIILTPVAAPVVQHIPQDDIPALVWFVREVMPRFDLVAAYKNNVSAKDAVIDVQPEKVEEPLNLDGVLAEIAQKVKAQTGQDLTTEQLEAITNQIDATLQGRNAAENLKPKVVSITSGPKN